MSEVDMSVYPDALLEIIKYLDFLPDDPQARIVYVLTAFQTGLVELYV